MKNFLIFIFLFSVLMSCGLTTNNKHDDLLESFYNTQIAFPDSVFLLNSSTKKIEKINADYFTAENKVITHINGQCDKCVDKLNIWDQTIVKQFEPGQVDFLFFVYSNDYSYFRNHIQPLIKYNISVIIDTTNGFEKDNKLLDIDPLFRTFLTDKDYMIKLIGDPTDVSEIRNLYFKVLNTDN